MHMPSATRLGTRCFARYCLFALLDRRQSPVCSSGALVISIHKKSNGDPSWIQSSAKSEYEVGSVCTLWRSASRIAPAPNVVSQIEQRHTDLRLRSIHVERNWNASSINYRRLEATHQESRASECLRSASVTERAWITLSCQQMLFYRLRKTQ